MIIQHDFANTINKHNQIDKPQIHSLIEGGSKLTPDEIERMKREAEANADGDKKERERIDKMNQADGLIFQTEKQIKEFGDKIPVADKTELDSALEVLKEAHKSCDIAQIDTSITKLNDIWNRVSTEMYKNTSADATTDASNVG